MATSRELTVDRDEAVKRVKKLTVMWRDQYIPGIARRRMSEGAKDMLRKDWTANMDSLIFALRAMGDFEL